MLDPYLDESSLKLFQPEPVLPSQFFGGWQRRERQGGEHRLMAAVLADALTAYCREVALNGRKSRRYLEVARWIHSTDESWPFAFERICDALHLDPAYLRGGLEAYERRERARRRAPVIELWRHATRRPHASRRNGRLSAVPRTLEQEESASPTGT